MSAPRFPLERLADTLSRRIAAIGVREVARRAGMPPSTVSLRARYPRGTTLQQLPQLARACRLELTYQLHEDTEKEIAFAIEQARDLAAGSRKKA